MKKFIFVPLVCIFLLSLFGCSSSSELPSGEAENTQEVVVYEDETLKADYLGMSETSGIVIMSIRLENKTDSEITVLPMDSSVDGMMVQFTSGSLATIQGGKSFTQSWIIGSVPDESIEFSMSICDKNMNELVQTDILTIEVE